MTGHGHGGWSAAIAARKERNVSVFDETMEICRSGWYMSPSGRRVALPPTEDVLRASRFYANPPDVNDLPPVAPSDVAP